MLTIVDTGPFSKAPAIAPILVATAGTTLVKSTSFTCTPGYTKKAIDLLLLIIKFILYVL